MKTNAAPKPNAADLAYTAELHDAQKLVKSIESLLRDHVRKQSTDTTNWSYAGDMAHVTAELRAIHDFLVGAT